jgi:hypothetical protein
MNRASELIKAMEEGHRVRKIVNPGYSNPQYIELYFWEPSQSGFPFGTIRLSSNYALRTRDDKRSWLLEMIEDPEGWVVIQ